MALTFDVANPPRQMVAGVVCIVSPGYDTTPHTITNYRGN